jgi:type III secretion protein J
MALMLRRIAILAVALFTVTACSVPVATNLDESDANHAVVVLSRGGVGADKERDPEHEGRFRVNVTRTEASAAISLLAAENLPQRSSPGVLEALGSGGVVPSRLAEHAKWTTGIAGDLERSFGTIDGVLSARVHLSLPAGDALDLEGARDRPSASILLRYRGATPPIAAGEVQRLVAGAVPNLTPEQVNVVMAASPAGRGPERDLVRFGPISVTRGSAPAMRAFAGIAAVLNLLLVAGLFGLWSRLRKNEFTLAEAKSAGLPDARHDRT